MNQHIPPLMFSGKLRSAKPVMARIGLILLSTDEVGGDAFTMIMPDDVRVFMTRTAYRDDSGKGGAFTLRTSFRDVAETLPPAGRFDVLAFSCTNATVAIGMDALLRELAVARPGVKYTSPAIAAVAALKKLKARNIALLTPYPAKTHKLFLPFFAENRIAVTASGTFGLEKDAEIGELSRDSIFKAAKTLIRDVKPDAVFISCTATPIVPHLAKLERELSVPVVSSTQAMAWDALRLAGYHKPIYGYGRLLASRR